jgi:hypothetical protein
LSGGIATYELVDDDVARLISVAYFDDDPVEVLVDSGLDVGPGDRIEILMAHQGSVFDFSVVAGTDVVIFTAADRGLAGRSAFGRVVLTFFGALVDEINDPPDPTQYYWYLHGDLA